MWSCQVKIEKHKVLQRVAHVCSCGPLVRLVHLNNSPGCEGWCNSPVQQQSNKAGLICWMPLKRTQSILLYSACIPVLGWQSFWTSCWAERLACGADDKKVPRLIVRCQEWGWSRKTTYSHWRQLVCHERRLKWIVNQVQHLSTVTAEVVGVPILQRCSCCSCCTYCASVRICFEHVWTLVLKVWQGIASWETSFKSSSWSILASEFCRVASVHSMLYKHLNMFWLATSPNHSNAGRWLIIMRRCW